MTEKLNDQLTDRMKRVINNLCPAETFSIGMNDERKNKTGIGLLKINYRFEINEKPAMYRLILIMPIKDSEFDKATKDAKIEMAEAYENNIHPFE